MKFFNKKSLLMILAVVLFVMPMVLGALDTNRVMAADLISTANDDLGLGYAEPTGLGTRDVREMTASIIRTLLGLLGIIAVVIILIGGFKWMTAMGEEEKVGAAKKLLGAGIIGLVIILCAYAIANYAIGQLVDTTTKTSGVGQ